jgi:hypothetical protein
MCRDVLINAGMLLILAVTGLLSNRYAVGCWALGRTLAAAWRIPWTM